MLERLQRMNNTLIFTVLALLFFPSSSYSMYCRRPAPRFLFYSRPQTPQRAPIGTRLAPSNSRLYCKSNTRKNLEKKIQQCKISEREHFENYLIWDEIVTECLWKGKCTANGKCNPKSNCHSNAQIAYIFWKAAQEELATHEIARNILTYGKH